MGIFCGSSYGLKSSYLNSAKILANELVKRDLTLIYGGANVGLMGEIANTVLKNNGKVIGVMPKHLVDREVAHNSLTKLYIVNSMHERKQIMAELSSGFIAMPGGFGTLDEICEIITWSQLGIQKKPCGFLNIDGFFDYFFKFIEHAVEQEFVKKETFNSIVKSSSESDLIDQIVSESF